MLKTLIIDDEPIALEKLRKYVERIPSLSLVGACSDAVEALGVIANNDIDLVITDINMPDLNGMEFARSLGGKTMVIFTTAHAEYAVDSYKVSAVDYLMKPYGFAEFSKAVDKALGQEKPVAVAAAQGDDSIFVKANLKFVRVGLSDIRFIKGYGEYLQIFMDSRPTPLVTLSSFAAIRERLSMAFIQVHRSYLVNMNRVAMVDRNRIFLDNDEEIPVGESYKADLQTYLLGNSIGASKP